jgi:hypothetical protein
MNDLQAACSSFPLTRRLGHRGLVLQQMVADRAAQAPLSSLFHQRAETYCVTEMGPRESVLAPHRIAGSPEGVWARMSVGAPTGRLAPCSGATSLDQGLSSPLRKGCLSIQRGAVCARGSLRQGHLAPP